MNVTQKIKMDLLSKQNVQTIHAVRGDTNSRRIQIALFEGGIPWEVPDGAHIAIAYLASNGANGVYDTLPNGEIASTHDRNKITILLVASALYPGTTKVTVAISDENDNQISTFPLNVEVDENYSCGASEPENYINLRQWMSAELSALLEELGVNRDFIFEVVGDVNTDATMADILAAEEAGRTIYCRLETDGQIVILLPKVKDDHGIYYFSAVCEGVEYLVTIEEDDAGNTVTNVTQSEVGGGDGNINPVAKTNDMTQPVGVDPDGKLFTSPASVSSEDIAAAVDEYMEKNPVSVDIKPQWAEFPRLTNPARDIYNSVAMANAKELGTSGNLRHNMMIEGDLITWTESTNGVDNASGAANVKLVGYRDKFGVGWKTENPTWVFTETYDVFPVGSDIYGVGGEVIDTVAASSDNAIIDLGNNNYIILAGCRGVSNYHIVYRTVSYTKDGEPTFGDTINVLKINGAEWDMTTLREDYTNKWSQLNTKVIKYNGNYYMAVVQDFVGIAIMKSSDGIDWSLNNHIVDKDCHLEACIGVVSYSGANRPTCYVVARHYYGDGYISLYAFMAIGGELVSKSFIPASTGRPMLSGWMGKDLYLTYSVNGRKNAILAQILPNSDGTTGVSILETPRDVMSNYPAIHVSQSASGARTIMFGGTNGLNSTGSGVSVSFLWNENADILKEKNEQLKNVMFGKSYTLPVATSEALGGVMPVNASDDMTQSVGVDPDGKLFTKPASVSSEDIAAAVDEYMEKNPVSTSEWKLLETKAIANGDTSVTINFDVAPRKVILSGNIVSDANASLCVVGNYTKWDSAYNRVIQIANAINTNASKQFVLELEKIADNRWLVSAVSNVEGYVTANLFARQLTIVNVKDLSSITLLSATDGQTFTGGTIETYVQ
jgi:hypothetical protein